MQDERLICAAHAVFSLNSVHEVIDLDRESAVERLIDFYGPEIDCSEALDNDFQLVCPLSRKPIENTFAAAFMRLAA